MAAKKRFLKVVVPIYNGGRRFAETMYPTIREQTFTDYRLICVDDMSDDDTPEILEELDCEVIRLESKGYAGGARNAAFKVHKTDAYTLCLDDDDVLFHDGVFQLIHDCAVENGMPDVIRMNYRNHMQGKEMQPLGTLVPTESTVERICLDWMRHMPWSMCVKSSKRTDFPEGITTDDGVGALRCLDECETAAVIPECCYVWNLRPGSITRSQGNPLQMASHHVELGLLYRMGWCDEKDGGLSHEWARQAARERYAHVRKKMMR